MSAPSRVMLTADRPLVPWQFLKPVVRVVALSCALLTACDPCAGTPSCKGGARVSYSGHIVERATGRSFSGTAVSFVRTSGVELLTDTLRAVSGNDGFFRLSADAKSGGSVTGNLHIAPAGRPGYDVRGITLQTTTVSGDGGNLGRFVIDPYIMYIAEIRSRLTKNDVGVPFAGVTFRRTGGIQIDPEVINTGADAAGRFFLAPVAKQPGTLEGLLTISATGFPRSYDIPVRIDTRYQDVVIRDVSVVNMGSALLWAGEVYRRVTNEHVAGIAVDFQRTSGIAVSPTQFSTITNSIGLFPIQPAPLGEGELVGTVTVHPPAPWTTFTVPNVRVRTMADDTVRLAGRFGFGAQVFGAIELRYRTTMTKVDSGTVTIFRRTSGIRPQQDSFTDRVNRFGYSAVQLASDATGETIGDFEVQLGEPYGTEIIRGVRLPSAEDDIQRFYGTHLVGRWFPQVAQVADSATRRAIPGARVTFTRQDGVRFTPDPYVVTPNADGYFALRPQPLADGDVVGNLTFELPAPYTSYTVRGLHLQTSTNDTLRFIGAFLFARPR